MMSKTACFTVIIAIIAVLGGCTKEKAPSRSGQSQNSGAVDGKVQIRVAWWGDTKRHELYNQIIDEFQKAYPAVSVVREPVSWTDYWDKLSVQTAGGNAPDFFGIHPQFAADYIPRGVCENLETFVADGTITTQGWSQGTIDTGKINGTLYMLPMGVTLSCVFVNTGLFEELGVAPPSFDWSWEDMKTIGAAVRSGLDAQGKNNVYLTRDYSSSLNSWRYFVRQQGREIYDAQGNIGFTRQDAEDWFAMFKEFRDLGIVPDGATSTEYANPTLEDGLFARNRALTDMVPVNQYKLYRATFPDKKIAIIRMPASPGNKSGEFPEGAHFVINAKSTPEKKRAAAQLMNFWLNSETALKLFGLDQGVPGNLEIEQAVIPTLDEYQREIVDFVEKVSKAATATIYPPSGASEIDALFRTIGEQVQFDVKTPQAAAKDFYEQSLAIRSKAVK
jgi:multiple sugar transport system substrate-binding protein